MTSGNVGKVCRNLTRQRVSENSEQLQKIIISRSSNEKGRLSSIFRERSQRSCKFVAFIHFIAHSFEGSESSRHEALKGTRPHRGCTIKADFIPVLDERGERKSRWGTKGRKFDEPGALENRQRAMLNAC